MSMHSQAMAKAMREREEAALLIHVEQIAAEFHLPVLLGREEYQHVRPAVAEQGSTYSGPACTLGGVCLTCSDVQALGSLFGVLILDADGPGTTRPA